MGRLICELDEPGQQQDQFWTYNGLGDLQKWQRGTVDVSGTTPAMPASQTTSSAWWDLDSQGTRSGGHYTVTDAPGAILNGPYGETTGLDQGGNQTVQTLGDTSQLHFTCDAWGRVVKATGNDGAIFAYTYRLDAFGRIISRIKYRMDENGRSTQVLERVNYFYDGNNVIEEQTGGAASTQYVWAPDGKLILRDRNADGKSTTGSLGKAGSGLDERTYALTDALGSVVAITDASGQLLERYVYRENGSVRALKPDWSGWPQGTGSLDGKSSRYDWVYLWHGGRDTELVKNCLAANQTDGSYIFVGGTWYDARHGTTMQPDPSLLDAGRNAYNPGQVQLHGWFWGSMGAVQTASATAVGLGLMMTPLAPLVIAGGLGYVGYQGYQGYTEYGGVGGSVAKMSGLVDIYEGLNNRHWYTGAELNLGADARTAMFTGGALQFAGTLWMGANAVRSAPSVLGYEWAIGPERDGSVVFGANRVWRRASYVTDDLRNMPGIVTVSQELHPASGRWLDANNPTAIPAQVAERLNGRQFDSFDDLREAIWLTIAGDKELNGGFSAANLGNMEAGNAPFAPRSFQINGSDAGRRFNLHHIDAIEFGGAVYDLANLQIVSPRVHGTLHYWP